MTTRQWTLVSIVLAHTACAGQEPLGSATQPLAQRPPIPVIFDNDMDFDDTAALAYLARLHKSGEIDLRLVSVTSAGAAYPGHGIQLARCLLERFGISDVPIAGSSQPGVHAFPDFLRFAIDGLLYDLMPDCAASDAPSAVPAEQAIVDVLAASDQPVTLLVTGPATNVARARELAATQGRPFASRIANIWAGGSLGIGGLCCGLDSVYDYTQHFNFWADPAAGQTMLDAALPAQTSLVGGHADAPITLDYVDRLVAAAVTPEGEYVAALGSHPLIQFGITSGEDVAWWDPLVVVSAFRERTVDLALRWTAVVVDESPASGRVFETEPAAGALVYYSISNDPATFEDAFLAGLNQ